MKATPTSVGWWPTQIWGDGDSPLPLAQGSPCPCTGLTQLQCWNGPACSPRDPPLSRCASREPPEPGLSHPPGFKAQPPPMAHGQWVVHTGRARTFPWSDSPMVTADQHFMGFLPVPLRPASANFHAQETEDKEMVMHCALQPGIC